MYAQVEINTDTWRVAQLTKQIDIVLGDKMYHLVFYYFFGFNIFHSIVLFFVRWKTKTERNNAFVYQNIHSRAMFYFVHEMTYRVGAQNTHMSACWFIESKQ